MKLRITFLSTLFVLTASAQRENLFSIDAQVRARAEYDNGGHTLRSEGEEPVLFIGNRTRLGVNYQRKNLTFKASGQYTGIWGDESIQKSNNHLSLNEAWGRLDFNPGFFVQVGRMPLVYDDEHLLGNSDWSLTGTWHDALRVGFEGVRHSVHLFATYYQDNDQTRGGYYSQIMPYKQMQGLWYHTQLLPDRILGISLIALNTGVEDGTAESGHTCWMQTMGGYLTFQPYNFDVAASFYYQRGKDASSDKVGAFMASGRIGYTFLNTIGIHAAYDYMSGNDGLNYNQHAFNPLFCTSHKLFGSMDYFAGRVSYGLQDLHAGIKARFNRSLSLTLDYHLLQMAEAVYGFHFDKKLGDELDLEFKAEIFKDVTLQAGYSVMWATNTLSAIQNGDYTRWQDWAWLSLNINPRLLLTNW
ncbi:MAG: alginate export family protein [Bacteroidales bacterium]|nr:alginate export family protein [Bacteroidales bacterium]